MPSSNSATPAPDQRITCHSCLNSCPEAEIETLEGEYYCSNCFTAETTTCAVCEDRHHNDANRYVESLSGYVCDDCYDAGDYFICTRCDNHFHDDDRHQIEGDDYCANCAERMAIDTYLRTSDQERLNRASKELQEEIQGRYIKSMRRFGVELETVYTKTNSRSLLSNVLHPSWTFHGDGSIRTSKNAMGGIEIVSGIMRGKKGEEEIIKLADHARGFGFFVNTSCGFHVHLEAKEFKRVAKSDKEEIHPSIASHKILYQFKHPSTGDTLHTTENVYDLPQVLQPNGSHGPVKHKVITQPQKNKVVVNRGPEFYRLRDLLYVYVAFDDVMRGMQPQSRRNNHFCKATSSLYSLDAIRALEDFGDLERMWYKVDRRRKLDRQLADVDERKHGKDESRYSGFNLEPILRHDSTTIEIRYHSPTLNASKILPWIDLHQTILDRVAVGAWDEDEVNNVLASEPELLRKAEAMFKIFGVSPDTREYVMMRLHKFNKLGASQRQLEDEEVEDSPLGRPLHSGHSVERLQRYESYRDPAGMERQRDIRAGQAARYPIFTGGDGLAATADRNLYRGGGTAGGGLPSYLNLDEDDNEDENDDDSDSVDLMEDDADLI